MNCTQDLGSSQLEETFPGEENIEVARLKIKDEEFPILIGNNVFGRDAECCSIVVNNATLSRKHAVIIAEDRFSHYIIDLGSRNKTRVNKRRLNPYQRTRLSHHTLVEFGEVSAEYLILLEQDKDEYHQVVPESEDEIVPETPVQHTKYGHESSSNSTSPTIFQMSSQCDCGNSDTCGKLLGEPCGINFINKHDINSSSVTLVDTKRETALGEQKIADFSPSNKAKDNKTVNETYLSGDETDPEDIFSNSVNLEFNQSANESSPSGSVVKNESAIKPVEESNLVEEKVTKESSSETDMSGDDETRGSDDFFNALTQVPPGGKDVFSLASEDADNVIKNRVTLNQEVMQEYPENLNKKESLPNKQERTPNFMNKESKVLIEESPSRMLCVSVEESVHSNIVEVSVTNCPEGENISCAATHLVTSNENNGKVALKLPPEKYSSHKLSVSLEENVHNASLCIGVGVTSHPEEEHMFNAATQLVISNENNLCLKQNFGDNEAKADVQSNSFCISSDCTKQAVVVRLENNSVDSKTDSNVCDSVNRVESSENGTSGTKHSQENLFDSEVDALCNAQTQIIPHPQGGINPDDNNKLSNIDADNESPKEDIFNAATEKLVCTNDENEACVSKCQEEEEVKSSSSNLCASILSQNDHHGRNKTKSSDEDNASDDFIFVASTQLISAVEERPVQGEEVFVAPTQLVPESVEKSRQEEEVFVEQIQLAPERVERSKYEEDIFFAATQLVPGDAEKSRDVEEMFLAPTQLAPEVAERSRDEEELFVAPTQLAPRVMERCRLEKDELSVTYRQVAPEVGEISSHDEEVVLSKDEGDPSKFSENIANTESEKFTNCVLEEDTSKCADESFFVASTQIVPCEKFPENLFDHQGEAKSPASTCSTYSSIHEAPTQCMDEIEGGCTVFAPKSPVIIEGPSAGCSTKERGVSLEKGSGDSVEGYPTHTEVSPTPHWESENVTLILPSTDELKKTAHDRYGDSPSETDEMPSPVLQTRTRRLRNKNLQPGTSKNDTKRKLKLSISDSESVMSCVEEVPDEKPLHKRSARTENKTVSKQIMNKGSKISKKDSNETVSNENNDSKKEKSKATSKEKNDCKKEKSKAMSKGKNDSKNKNSKAVSKEKSDTKKVNGKIADEPNPTSSIDNTSVPIQQSSMENTPKNSTGRPSRLRKITWKARDSYDCPIVVHKESKTLNIQCDEVNKNQTKERKPSLGKSDSSRSIDSIVSLKAEENNTPVTRKRRSSILVSEKKIVTSSLCNRVTEREVNKDDVESSRERSNYRRKSERATLSEKEGFKSETSKKRNVFEEKIHEATEKTKIGCSKLSDSCESTQEIKMSVQRSKKRSVKESVGNISVESDQLHEKSGRRKVKDPTKSKRKINGKEQEKEKTSEIAEEGPEKKTIASTAKGKRGQREILREPKEGDCEMNIPESEVHPISDNYTRRNTRRRNCVKPGIDPQPCVKSSSRGCVSKKDDVRTKLNQGVPDSVAKKQELVTFKKEEDGTNEEQKRKTRFSKVVSDTHKQVNSLSEIYTTETCSESPQRNKVHIQCSNYFSPSSTKGQKSGDNLKNTKLKNKEISNVDTCTSSGDSESMLESPVIKTRAQRMSVKSFPKALKSVGSADASQTSIVEGKMDSLSDDLSTPRKRKKVGSSLSSQRGDKETAVAVDLKQSCLKDFEKQNNSNSPTIQRLKRSKQSDSSESLSCSGESTPKRSCRLSMKVHYNVMFTGVAATKTEENVIKTLGGKLVEEIEDCTVLITDKVRRTLKFLCILGQGKPIVSARWLEESRLKGYFLDPWNFIVQDKEAEKKFKFSLEQSLRKACDKKLLDGYSVHATPSVLPPPAEMKGIVQCCGGKYLSQEPSSTSWPKKSFVVASANDKKLVGKIRNKVTVVSPELILTGVLQQKLDFKEHSFK